MRYSFTLNFTYPGGEVSKHWIETHLPAQHFGHRDLRVGPEGFFTLAYSEFHASSPRAARDVSIAMLRAALPFAKCSNPDEMPRTISVWTDGPNGGPQR